MLFLALFGFSLAVPGLSGVCRNRTIETVDLDLNRYQGSWYEISHSASFLWYFIIADKRDRDCVCTTAEYSMFENGHRIRILNSCRKGKPDAPVFQKQAAARLIGKGHLKVNFFYNFPLADGDYRVLYTDYDYSIVISCSRIGGSLVWFLARTPQVSEEKYNWFLQKAKEFGIDTSDLVSSRQDGCWAESLAAKQPLKTAFEGALPTACALRTQVSDFPARVLADRWHILYTQPDFMENLYSKDCFCNTVTLENSTLLSEPYPGTFRCQVTCRLKSEKGKRSDFIRPVYEISPLSSLLGHFVQQLWGGVAQEHWQVLAYGQGGNISSTDLTVPINPDEIEHLLIYVCLDTRLFGRTFCVSILSREKSIPDEARDKYFQIARDLGVFKEDVMRPVVHNDQCIYDPKPVQALPLVLQK